MNWYSASIRDPHSPVVHGFMNQLQYKMLEFDFKVANILGMYFIATQIWHKCVYTGIPIIGNNESHA